MPNLYQKLKARIVKFGVWKSAGIAVIVLAVIGSQMDKRSKAGKEDLCSMAYIIHQDIVKNLLKSPSTADFPWNDYRCSRSTDKLYRITSYVDSQNGFGAMIRTDYQISLEYQGGEPADPRSWKMVDFQPRER